MSDDDIGYKKPPVQYRFKKGFSGNPRGRPKSARTQPAIKDTEHLLMIDQILSEQIEVRESGSQKHITKREAFLKKLYADAMTGNRSAAKTVMHYIEAISLAKEAETPAEQMKIVVTFVSPKDTYEHDDGVINQD